MKKTNHRPKCHSTDIIAGVQPLDLAHGNAVRTAALATYRNPTALFLKGRQSTPMAAWVCGECGYVELYADDPRALKL